MPGNVCCPNCWTWSPLDKRTTCKCCGSALILSDGRTVEDATLAPPPPPPAYLAGPFGAVAMTPAAIGPIGYSAARVRDWVAVCKWITLGYGGVVAVVLLVVGLLVRHLSVPVTDPTTGLVVVRTLDIGPAFAIAAVFTFGIFALLAWLTRFPIARGIFALFTVLGIFSTTSNLGLYAHDLTLELGALLGLAINVAYGWALLMSFIRPAPQPQY